MRIDFQFLSSLFLATTLAAAAALPSYAQLTVDVDLGTVTTGSTIDLEGNSSDTGRQVQTYPGPAFSNLIFGSETVYEFDIATPFQIEATFNSQTLPNADDGHDIIVLDGLSSGVSPAGFTAAFDAVERINFTAANLPETLSSGAYRPGTYYLSVSTQGGLASGGDPASFQGPEGGLFDIDLSFLALPEVTLPTATDLGVIATAGEAFTLDTFGSVNGDTVLGLYDSEGFIVAENDDAAFSGPNAFRSAIDLDAGLPAGTYYAAVGEFRTTYGFGFDVDVSASSPRDPSITFNFNGQTTTGLLPRDAAAGDPVWFSFQVAVPEPATATMLIFAAAFTNGVRRRGASARR